MGLGNPLCHCVSPLKIESVCVRTRYLLGQNGDSFLVFGISQIDAVNREDGVSNMQTSTSVRGLTRMDLGN